MMHFHWGRGANFRVGKLNKHTETNNSPFTVYWGKIFMLQLYTHTPHMRKNMAAVMSEWELNFYYFVQLRQKTEMTSPLSTNHLSSCFKMFQDGRRKARDYIFARHDTSIFSIWYPIG